MRWRPSDLPDLTGRTALVTGANSGIGAVAARELAAHGARVVLACRKTDAGRKAAERMDGEVSVEELDLASLDSVRALAERWEGPLDLLVNNAGVMTPPRHRTTADGFELQYGTNHLGHFALTGRLLPALLGGTDPRVVTISSIAHHTGDGTVLEGNPAQGYMPPQAYGNSKLANLLFARELQRRATEAGAPLTSTAAHPGVSSTGLFSSRDGLGAIPGVRLVAPLAMRLVLQSAKRGADPTLYAATAAEPGSYTGPQWLGESRGPIGPAKVSRYAQDEQLARAVWDKAEQETGVTYDW